MENTKTLLWEKFYVASIMFLASIFAHQVLSNDTFSAHLIAPCWLLILHMAIFQNLFNMVGEELLYVWQWCS
jgi:hypothetical protein